MIQNKIAIMKVPYEGYMEPMVDLNIYDLDSLNKILI